jgi:hypothetical protein
MTSPQTTTTPTAPHKSWLELFLALILLALLGVGILYRFSWVNWNQDANLHPDEYGLTNTLTVLKMPKSLGEYFNTRLSPLSPYPKYDEAGNKLADGPDNRMRWGQWPIILLRWAGELSGNTGYGEIRLMGRQLSALADTLAILLLFLIGWRLFNRTIALLAATLSSLAVMQIQQSHFMTVDNFGVLFTMLALYACVRIAQCPLLRRDGHSERSEAISDKSIGGAYRLQRTAWTWYLLFGVAFGMALAARINLLPLFGLALVAAFISVADLKLKHQSDLTRIALVVSLHLLLAGVVALLTFRVCQPMAFRAAAGDTTFFSWRINPDWSESMKVAQMESSGIGGGPPAEQWAHRPAIIFPLMNMLLWGMGLPLGMAAWGGFAWSALRFLRGGRDWKLHLIPLVWVGGYFLFMGTRWVKSVRYFLPIYPFLALFAAWALVELWRKFVQAPKGARTPESAPTPTGSSPPLRRMLVPVLLGAIVLLGTLAWADAFVTAIYRTDHTRIQASRWIYNNIPAPFQLTLVTAQGMAGVPIGAQDDLILSPAVAYIRPFTPQVSGDLARVTLAHAAVVSGEGSGQVRLLIARDTLGQDVVAETILEVPGMSGWQAGPTLTASFTPARLEANQPYFLIVSPLGAVSVHINRTVISNENWDEGLPVYDAGYNPFGDFYRGLTMEVRWYDDENKRQMFLENLSQVDFIILPSQRAIWSASRIPRTYPMTLEYYRALFDGRLGFDLVAEFDSPMRLGALFISDVGGVFAWGVKPKLPLFNYSQIAAEEAFSVYDHPPVWIFKKRADFSLETARTILGSIDLSQVVVQGPRDAEW